MFIYLGEIASTFNEMCVQREVDPKEVLQDMLLDLTDNKIQRRKLKTAFMKVQHVPILAGDFLFFGRQASMLGHVKKYYIVEQGRKKACRD